MIKMEIHPGEGGADAQAFAAELASAVARYTGQPAELIGGAWTLHRL